MPLVSGSTLGSSTFFRLYDPSTTARAQAESRAIVDGATGRDRILHVTIPYLVLSYLVQTKLPRWYPVLRGSWRVEVILILLLS